MSDSRGGTDEPKGAPANYQLFEESSTGSGHPAISAPTIPSAQPSRSDERDLRTFVALSSVKGMGRASLAAVYDAFSPISSLWDAGPEALADVLKLAKNRQADAVAHRVWIDSTALMARAAGLVRQFENEDVRIVFRTDADYPHSLHDLSSPPRWLYVMGAFKLLHRVSSVAVVGTREPTQSGRLAARRAGQVLADAGFVVISGLAEGIDQEVHTSVLQHGGDTIAVLGNGFGVEFPAGSGTLRRQIVERGGAIVTEYLPSESYSRRSFIDRNRIQAALASAVIPVQGARQSGTAHTVRFAQELGRLLMGVWATRPAPTPENEMLEWLVEMGETIYDLSRSNGVAALLAALSPYAADAKPPIRDPIAERRRTYRGAIKLLQDALTERPPTEEDARWLIEGIERMVQHAAIQHSLSIGTDLKAAVPDPTKGGEA